MPRPSSSTRVSRRSPASLRPGRSHRHDARRAVRPPDPLCLRATGRSRRRAALHARFTGTTPLGASIGEVPPTRSVTVTRNRRINCILHIMAITQLRYEPRAQAIVANLAPRVNSKKEARRVFQGHLTDVIDRRMIRDQTEHPDLLLAAQPAGHTQPSWQRAGGILDCADPRAAPSNRRPLTWESSGRGFATRGC